NAGAPNQFVTSLANASATDLGASSDGSLFSFHSNAPTEMHATDLSLTSVPASAELEQIPGRVLVPGLALHPSGALLYQPFLTGVPGTAGVKGGIDILDAHSGALRLRIFLPQQFMTDIDGLHGSFLTTDENGQRLFAITSSDGTPQNSALTIIQLAAVPLGIGTIAPAREICLAARERIRMETRKLGNSDINITRVGFGAWALGGGGWEFAWGPQDDADSIAAIHRALELGVNWIDTAAVYGLGHSEEI